MKKLFVFMFSVIVLMGCGGGDDGGGNPKPQGDVSVNGTVINSVYSSADIVCYDRNGNKKCDAGEPSAAIASDGVYALTGTEADAVAVPIVAELANSGSGTSSLAAGSNTRLVFEAPAGQRIISSLSTIVKAKLDSDPSLSFDDAHAAVQGDLNTSEDLFSTSSAVASLAAEITAVIVAMFDDLSDRFGIMISDKVIMLVISEIIPQLTDIVNGKTPGQVVNDTTGGMTETDVEDKMDDLAESMPKVMRTTDVFDNGLQVYQFEYEDYGTPADSYRFRLCDFTKSALRMYVTGGYLLALPNTTNGQNIENYVVFKNSDGSVTISSGEGNQIRLTSLEAIPVGGKSFSANPRHNNKTINFSSDAIMYKLVNYHESALPSISRLRNGCNGMSINCGPVTLNGNTVEIRWTDYNVDQEYNIIMNNNGTYEVLPKRNIDNYEDHDVFSQKLPFYKGKYVKTTDNIGDIYTFKDVDNKTVFFVFKASYDGYDFAGRLSGNMPLMLFNKIAAEDIKNQW